VVFEESLVYFPSREMGVTPTSFGLPHEEVTLSSSDGTRIHGWFLPARPPEISSRAILFCHGNAGNICGRLDRALFLQRLTDLDIFLFDYRGFGKSEGSPSETGTYFDAAAAHGYLVERKGIPNEAVILLGESLGAAVAIELAVRGAGGALVLEAPFTSIADMARVAYPLLAPFTTFLRTRYDNLKKIPDVAVPLLLLHGRRDQVVPFAQGEALFRAAREPKTFVALERAGHADGFLVESERYGEAWKSFLSALDPAGERER
jgi:fermentation-respiration switch protein FrsA (DUF1100 family)